VQPPAHRPWLIVALGLLSACHPNDYVVVKLEAATGLPAIAQLKLQASDAASQSTTTEPSSPVATGLTFPTTYVVATPQSGAVTILVSGLDPNGNVIARGGTTAVASSSVQAVVVTLSATCASTADCDPAGVCSGAVTCGDAGSCVPSNGAVATDATPCGDDGGHCYSGACHQTVCGDGIVEVGEQCDLGTANDVSRNSNSGTCTLACQLARCGDGYTNQDPLPDGGFFQELCDWGAAGGDGGDGSILSDGGNSDVLPNHCRDDCLPARCGDDVVDTGERCDLGPAWPDGGGGNGTGTGCNATCTLFGNVSTLTGTGDESYQDGPLNVAIFNGPRGITLIGQTLYVADEFNDLIRAVDLDAGLVSTLAGLLMVDETIDGDAGTAAFESPIDVTVFQDGLAVAEPTDVRTVTLTGTVATLVGSDMVSISDGPFGDAGFVNLQAITSDGPDLYVTDPPLGLRRLDIAAQTVTTVTPDGGMITGTSTLSGVTSMDGGLLFVTDRVNNDVQSVDPLSDLFQFIAGDPGGAGGFVDGVGLAARFNAPTGLCTDGQSIYVADQLNASVRQVVPATGSVTTLAGDGTAATTATPQNGVGRAATFFEPAACVWDPVTGTLFVTDSGGNDIREIQ
jgi:hypothetical protein